MKKLSISTLLLLALLPHSVMAKAIIFVQGYEENGTEWRSHGVTIPLVAEGWRDGGHLFGNPISGILSTQPQQGSGGDSFYTVDLPTEAPLGFQLQILSGYVEHVVQNHPGEALIFAGHSAGGVLARLFMVQNRHINVAGLMTIAAPHRGTGLSEAGLIIGQSPLSWGLPMIGADSINRSQGLYNDLVREAPGNFLFDLNRDIHPVSRYLSVVRDDWVIAPESQDMRLVAALMNSGMVETIFSVGDHELNPNDGLILARFVTTIN